MQQLFRLGISVVDMVLYMIFLDCFLQPFEKIRRWQMYLYAILLGVVQAYVARFLEIDIQQIVLYIILHVFMSILFVNAFHDVWFLFVIFTFGRIVCAFFIQILFEIVFQGTDFVGRMERIETWIAIMLQGLMVYYIKVFNSCVEEQKMKLYWKMLLFPGIELLLIIVFLRYQFMQNNSENTVFYIVFIMFIVTICYYFFVERMKNSYECVLHQKISERQDEDYQKRYYEQLEYQQKEIRAIRHDMKNQLLALLGELENENIDRAINEIKGMLKEIEDTTAIFYTANSGMNAVLNFKVDEMKRKQICFSCEIDIPAELRIEARDLGTLIGNMLDNAIEACEKCFGKRYISLKAVYHNYSLIIVCENSTTGYVEHLLTEKADKTVHGIGVISMKQIVKSYGGEIELESYRESFRVSCILWNV